MQVPAAGSLAVGWARVGTYHQILNLDGQGFFRGPKSRDVLEGVDV